MTTIATDGKTIACDSYLTDHHTIGHVDKLFEVPGGWLGVAGAYSSAVRFVEWLRAEDKEADEPDLTDVSAILLAPTGVYMYEGCNTPYKLVGPFNAVGSGSQAALAAMHLGASPTEAVNVAAKVDPYTGGRITTVGLQQCAESDRTG